MSNDKFKNSPIHDKQAIISMMDELEPKDMVEVVELLKSKQQKADKQQTAVHILCGKLAMKLGIPQAITFYIDHQEEIREAKEMEKEQSNAKINIAIKEFETLKSKANSLKDVVYLDGVLTVLDSIKNETYGGGEQ